jgi:signal transduction histidine kinase
VSGLIIDVLWVVFTGVGTGFLAGIAVLAIVITVLLRPLPGGRSAGAAALRYAADVAGRERRRIHRVDEEVEAAFRPTSHATLITALQDPSGRRELGWLLLHGTLGLASSALSALAVIYVVQDLTFPLWFRLAPPDHATYPWPQVDEWAAHDFAGALPAVLFGLLLLAIATVALPITAVLQRAAARRLLNAPPGVDLLLRVAEVTASRAAALEAHTAELRRIERVLHDGVQSRLVAVSVLLGITRRAIERGDPEAVSHIDRAQEAIEDALTDLRGTVREFLPPVLHDRGLTAAIEGLVQRCAVPCTFHAGTIGRCPTTIEATVYYAVAEALANVSKHSRAARASVLLERTGDELTVVQEYEESNSGCKRTTA